MSASERSGYYIVLMFIDLDNFKPLNDIHGHMVGDLLLIEVAARLSNCVRKMDTVARFGGEEFVVMIRELDTDKTESLKQADIVAEKIRAALAEPYLLKFEDSNKNETLIEHHCSSIGVVVFHDHQVDQRELLKCADSAMYRAKEAGRNSIRYYDLSTH